MQTRLTLLVILLTICLPVSSFAISGNVSGNWTIEDSPVTVDGDVVVDNGTALTIDPGVVVRFTGPFSFTVKGTLTAVGTSGRQIVFTRAAATDASKWHGIRFDNSDDASILEYCTVEYTNRQGENHLEVLGGGVFIDGCSPTIRSCTIRYNNCSNTYRNGSGGGIYIGGGSSSRIEYNLIAGNLSDSGGGIFVGGESWPTISNNRIVSNTAYSSGGGIYVAAWAEATIESNIVRGNTAYYWGGGGITLWNNTCSGGPCTDVYNNVIYKNSAVIEDDTGFGNGGGLYCRYNQSNLFNNTIIANTAQGEGGGVYVLDQGNTYPTLTNTIIRNNSAPASPQIGLAEITLTGGGSLLSEAVVNNSNIEGGWSGTGAGNIDTQPLFTNPAVGHFQLLPGSPGIDVGDNLANLPAVDIAGNNRIIDGDGNSSAIVDMGAYEYDPAALLPGDIDNNRVVNLADTILLLQLLAGKDIGLTGDMTGIDVNGDNIIGFAEVLFGIQYLSGTSP